MILNKKRFQFSINNLWKKNDLRTVYLIPSFVVYIDNHNSYWINFFFFIWNIQLIIRSNKEVKMIEDFMSAIKRAYDVLNIHHKLDK